MPVRLLAQNWEIFAKSLPIDSAGSDLVHTIICSTRSRAPLYSDADVEKSEILSSHKLITNFKVEIDPTRNVFETFRHHSSFLAKTPINLRRSTFFETLDHHVKHLRHCSHSERSRGIPLRKFRVNLRDPSTPLRFAQDD